MSSVLETIIDEWTLPKVKKKIYITVLCSEKLNGEDIEFEAKVNNNKRFADLRIVKNHTQLNCHIHGNFLFSLIKYIAEGF